MSDNCEHCGANLNVNGCLVCGAPVCCPQCCKIESLTSQLSEVKEERDKLKSADYWCNWVYPDGANPQQVQNELHDYNMILENVSKVYDHITDGRITKANTLATEVVNATEESYGKIIEKAEAKNKRLVEALSDVHKILQEEAALCAMTEGAIKKYHQGNSKLLEYASVFFKLAKRLSSAREKVGQALSQQQGDS